MNKKANRGGKGSGDLSRRPAANAGTTKGKQSRTAPTPRKRTATRRPIRYRELGDWEAAARIDDGFETGRLDDIRTSLDLTVRELSVVLQMSPRTLNRRKSQDRLPPDESERVYRILKLIELATDVLGSEDDARDWMKEANFALAERTPLDLAKSEPGAAIVERLLEQIRHGVAV
ncbi:MAG: DUF2384 domain-containing protein [Rhodothermales bacterium]|nr:DUF2384 domain-containing protein [Rhodothermales bacterium]